MFILVIVYGPPLRRDDSAKGTLATKLVRHWQKLGIAAQQMVVAQLTPELAAEMARIAAAVVVFVHRAGTAGNTAGLEVRAIDLDTPSSGLDQHLEPAALMRYAQLLYNYRAPAWLITTAEQEILKNLQ
jgi:hypothetical protein